MENPFEDKQRVTFCRMLWLPADEKPPISDEPPLKSLIRWRRLRILTVRANDSW